MWVAVSTACCMNMQKNYRRRLRCRLNNCARFYDGINWQGWTKRKCKPTDSTLFCLFQSTVKYEGLPSPVFFKRCIKWNFLLLHTIAMKIFDLIFFWFFWYKERESFICTCQYFLFCFHWKISNIFLEYWISGRKDSDRSSKSQIIETARRLPHMELEFDTHRVCIYFVNYI